MTLERILNVLNTLASKNVIIEEKGDDAFMYYIFFQLYGQVPYVDYFFDDDDEEEDDDDDDFIPEKFNYKKTINNLLEKCPDAIVYSWKGYRAIFTDEFIVFRGTIFHLYKERPQVCIDSIVLEKNDRPNLIYISVDSKGIIHKQLVPIRDADVSIEDNYNDDCPYTKIEEAVEHDNKSTILLLFGLPGTGKTFLLRKCKNGIFIMEDCESIIKNREESYNALITPLLQLTDGLIGDNLGLKFICTFNTDLQNVDPALQRKGRCALSYEFKKLAKVKVQNLWNKLGVNKTATGDMALCDVLNVHIENGSKEKRKVGF